MPALTGPRNGLQYAAALGEGPPDDPWNVWMDLNLRFLERAGVHLSVINRTTTAPPGSPSNGDTYIVAAGATGAWATHDGKIAYYSTEASEGAGWKFYTPRAGWLAWDAGAGELVRFSGGAWAGVIAAIDAVVYKGATDCSANPNYPAADAGHLYFVSVAGKIGGAAGVTVEAGDMFICKADGTAGGNHATVGASWNVIQSNIDLTLYALKASPTFTGNHTVSEAFFETGAISPAALAAATHDWAPAGFSTCSVIRASCSAAVAVTGLAGGGAGRVVTLQNVGAIDLLLSNEDAGSTAANRFAIRRGLILPPNKGVTFWYDGTSSRWRLKSDQDRSCTVVLAADQTNNNAVADTLQDVTGLSFPVLSGKTYKFRFVVAFTSAAVATGARFTVSGPAATNITYLTETMASTMSGAHSVNGSPTAYDVASVTAAVPNAGAPGPFLATVWGLVTPSADGTLIARFASEVSGSAVVAKAGLSYVDYECIST